MKFKSLQYQTLPKARINTLFDLHKQVSIIKPFSSQTTPPFHQREITSYYTLSQTLQECLTTQDFQTANSVHAHIIKLRQYGLISFWNKLLNLYCKCKHIRLCRTLFDKMPQRDIVSYNTMISTYIRSNGGTREAVLLYRRMHEECVRANHITLSTLLGGKVNLEMVHGQAVRYGFSSNEFVGSSLVDGYAKRMRLNEAMHAFDEIAELDLVSWNIMIDGCVCNGSRNNALRMFSRLRSEGVEFDAFTLTSVIKACMEPEDLEQGMQLHGCAVKVGLAGETPIGNALITMYSKCEKVMVLCVKIFDEIIDPNIISWTAMVAGFMQNGLNMEAIVFYQRMLRLGVNENEFSFASILPAYSSLASLEQGTQVHARIMKTPFQLDVSVGNALIDMYFKCGSLIDAELAFRTMERHDVVSWTIMVTGLGQHGKAKEAVDVLKEMINKGMKPDAVTFLGSISACGHGGLVDEGLQIFRSMIDVHHVKPKREHYACVVDMLGRAGRLEEAERFIAVMGIDADVLVWEALLGACKTHGEMELGERSAKKIMALEPRKNGPYVLLANLYADKGLWQGKSMARESLTIDGLRKEAGSSWVATQDRI